MVIQNFFYKLYVAYPIQWLKQKNYEKPMIVVCFYRQVSADIHTKKYARGLFYPYKICVVGKGSTGQITTARIRLIFHVWQLAKNRMSHFQKHFFLRK